MKNYVRKKSQRYEEGAFAPEEDLSGKAVEDDGLVSRQAGQCVPPGVQLRQGRERCWETGNWGLVINGSVR